LDEERNVPLSEEQIRAVLDCWSSRRFFRLQRLGARIELIERQPADVYRVRLLSETEQRSVSTVAEPYRGGPIDDRGGPQNPDQVAVPPAPPRFQTATYRAPLAHSESVAVCSDCRGSGATNCIHCGGMGWSTCPVCGGSGVRTETRINTQMQSDGTMRTVPETVTAPCGCNAGRTMCLFCSTSGRVTCSRCSGVGRLKRHDELTVAYRPQEVTRIVHSTSLPDWLLAGTRGEPVLDVESPRFDGVPPLTPEPLLAAITEVIATARAESGATVLYQRLIAERIPVLRVRYAIRGPSKKRPGDLWIYGSPMEVFAPDVPRDGVRITGAIAGAVLLLAMVVAAYLTLTGVWPSAIGSR